MNVFGVLLYIGSSLMVFVSIHVVISRLMNRSLIPKAASNQRFLILLTIFSEVLFLFVLFVLLVSSRIEVLKILTTLIYSGIVFGCFAYAYFHFFNMSDTGRRVRIMVEVLKNKKLSSKDLESLYSASDMLNIRIKRLKDSRQIVLNSNNRYIVRSKILVKVADLLKAFSTYIRNRQR